MPILRWTCGQNGHSGLSHLTTTGLPGDLDSLTGWTGSHCAASPATQELYTAPLLL